MWYYFLEVEGCVDNEIVISFILIDANPCQFESDVGIEGVSESINAHIPDKLLAMTLDLAKP